MKIFSLILVLLSTTSVFAEETISGAKMATLLSSEYTAPCLAKLYDVQKSYEVSVEQYSFKVLKDEAKESVKTTIGYVVVQGGDMVVGRASIIVTEKLFTPFGAPPTVKIPRVVSCDFESQIRQ